MSLVRRRRLLGVVELARGGLVERLDDEGGFAAAGNAGDAGQETDRDFRRHVLEIVGAGADDPHGAFLVEWSALGRHRHIATAGEVVARQRAFRLHNVLDRPFGHDHPAMDAGAGPDVHHMVGGADRVLVVLDDENRIAEIAQTAEGLQETFIVALMEADRRFVEHIEHAGEPRPDLRGEADALAFAAGERARRARQGEIVEAHIVEEEQPFADFLQDARGDRHLFLGEGFLNALEPLAGGADRFFARLRNRQPADFHGERFGLQSIGRCRRRNSSPTESGKALRAPSWNRFRENAAPDWE